MMETVVPVRAWMMEPQRGDLLAVVREGHRAKSWVLVLNESSPDLPDFVTLETHKEIFEALSQHELELRIEDGVPTGVRGVGTQSFTSCRPW